MLLLDGQALRGSASALVIGGLMLASSGALAEETLPSAQEMWRIIQAQANEIAELKALVGGGAGQAAAQENAVIKEQAAEIAELKARVAVTEEKIDATGAAMEAETSESGGESWFERTSIGGYGELHYNGGAADQIDFHRFVLFVSHRFNDWIRLQSELELEHSLAGEGKPGEVELEQAFIEFDLTEGAGLQFGSSDRHFAKVGLFLVPVGLLNETHEPATFYGVERNPVEANIIPTTWWEGGVGLNGQMGGGFSYDLAFHSGLQTPIAGGSAFKVRSGRKKVANAPGNDPAITARLRWTGVPGVEIGVAGQYQADVTQGALGIDATMLEAHAAVQRGGFGLRALYARWDLDGVEPALIGRDKQVGWYVEPSYRFETKAGDFGFFTRYQQWDNEAGLAADTLYKQTVLGMNYWPHPDVVLKVDYQFDNPPPGVGDDDRINLGVGFQF